jgi:hypothetical protein
MQLNKLYALNIIVFTINFTYILFEIIYFGYSNYLRVHYIIALRNEFHYISAVQYRLDILPLKISTHYNCIILYGRNL